MKKLVVILILLFMGWNVTAQKYVYFDGNCRIELLVKYNQKSDSAHLNLKFTNEGKLPILTGGVFYAHWNVDHSSVLLTFGEVFKIWNGMEYELKSIKPDSSAYWDFSVKNFFTDSTTASFGGGYVISRTLKMNKVFTNKDFTYDDVKQIGFVFYPTYRDDDTHKFEKGVY